MENPEFIGFKEAMKEFGLGEKKLRSLTKRKGCPMLPRERGQNYQINKQRFAEWLDNQRR